MSEMRGTTTSQLASIIEVIQLGKKTGNLIVERGEGREQEKGIITFINGYITQVSANQQSGMRALTWLSAWGECRFSFVVSRGDLSTGTDFMASSVQDAKPLPKMSNSNRLSMAKSENIQTTGSLPKLKLSNLGIRERSKNAQALRETDSILHLTSPLHAFKLTPVNDAPKMSTHTDITARQNSIPHRIQQLEDALHILEQEGLSRIHRHLLLLIDGHRLTSELGRLTGRQQKEVQDLLRDLENVGVIQQ